LICFLVWAFACGLRAWWARGGVWSIFTGLAAGLALATKESWALVVLAAIPAAGILILLTPSPERPGMREFVRVYWPAVVTALVVAVLLYSSFFTNPRGVVDSVLTFLSYELLEGHEKP